MIVEQDPSYGDGIREIFSLDIVRMLKNPSKSIHYVPKCLSNNGSDIRSVNHVTDKFLDKKCHDSTFETKEIDIVDIFRPADQVLPVIQETIKKKPKTIWFQEDIGNTESENLTRQARTKIIFNRCMLVEYLKLSI